MPSLPELQRLHQFDTDKDDVNHRFRGRSYLDVYEELLGRLREQELTLLELGVLRGGSLRLWRDYFPRAQVVGVDIDGRAGQNVPAGVRFVHARQTDEAAIVGALASLPPLGVVIDDGSHYVPHMLASFRFLWPLVMDGGVYVMEDTAITYHQVDPNWPGMPLNQQDFAPNRREDLDALLSGLIREMDARQGTLRALEFHPMMIALRKSVPWVRPALSAR
jgi:hypothetical protein